MRSARSELFAPLGLALALLVAPLGGAPAFAQTPGEDDGALEMGADEVGGDEAVEMGPEYKVDPAVLQRMLTDGKAFLASGHHLLAAAKFFDAVSNGDPIDPIVQEAQFQLAVTLYQLKLYQSALTRLEPIVDEGDNHPKYLQALPYLLYIAREAGSGSDVLDKLSRYPEAAYPPDLAGELHFLVGQYFFNQDAYDEALAHFQKVGEDQGRFYVRARFLEGVIHTVQSNLAQDPAHTDVARLKAAAESFKKVLRYKRDHGGDPVVDNVARMAHLALGRLFFSTRQYNVALRYYDQVERGGMDWLNALFEVSWVYFQLRKYPRALGNLHTLNSPYFADQYFPESRVLQALILFYNCHYKESLAVVQDFVNEYLPIMKKLKEQVNQFSDPNAFYGWLAKLATAGEDIDPRFRRIFSAALADRKVRHKFGYVAVLDRELKHLDTLAGAQPEAANMLETLRGEVTAIRSLVVGEAGSIAQTRLQRVLKELRGHLAGALKIKGETLKAQRGALNATVKAEQKAAAAAQFEITLDSEHFEWPFTGEYWKDELGSYVYDVKSACAAPTSKAPAGGASGQ